LARVRTSRLVEEALQVRMDFLWLAQGRTIDHTTFSEFRRKHKAGLKDLFKQVLMVAHRLEMLGLTELAYDGTRERANNRRSGTRTPAELRQLAKELQIQYDELTAKMEAEEQRDQERFGLLSTKESASKLPEELADVVRRKKQIDQALQEIDRLEQAGETIPKWLPITDPESRVMPNKEGGFAPNYTPTATVDVKSGLIVDATVLAVHNEDQHLFESLAQVQETFGLESLPAEVLVDGLIGTGANLAKAEELGVTIYSPCEIPDPSKNPALRADPTQPVPEADWARLPTKGKDEKKQLDKSAFVYDEERDCYWCPTGHELAYRCTTTEKSGTGQRIRRRYQAEAEICAACPLRDLCLQGKAKARQINREQYESQRERHAERMATPEAHAKYAQRRHPGERPFAVIKHQFGFRQFLLRGLDRVQQEWSWATIAFNLKQIMSWSRAGPNPKPVVST
jgi:transposase